MKKQSNATSAVIDTMLARLRAHDAMLGAAGRRVTRVIAEGGENQAAVLAGSARDIALRARTSDATVIRTVQALGFSGIADLKQALVASISGDKTPAAAMRQTFAEIGAESSGAIDLVLDTHLAALEAMRSPANRERIAAAVKLLHRAERIVTFGIGPSGPLAEYAALLLQRAGRRSHAITATGIGLADALLDLRPGDTVLALAYGRPYREVLTLFAEARRQSVAILLITDDGAGRVGAAADLVLIVPRGRAQRVALHGVTLIALETLVLALAAAGRDAALAALDHLNELRRSASGDRHDAG